MIGMRSEATSARIRQIAAELFAEQGYERTSLREIAERLGMTKAALYYHYRSKEELLKSIVAPLLDEMRRLVASADDPGGVPLQRRFFADYLEILLRHRSVCSMLFRDSAAIVAIVPLFEELKDLALRMQVRLAGPDSTPEKRVRAAAALEVLSVALAAEAFLPGVPDDVLRATLLDAAGAVLAVDGAG